MKTVRAFAPGNISLLFKVVPSDNPDKHTALGSGFTVREGATVTVSQGPDRISYNGKKINLPTVLEVAHALTNLSLSITITSELPLGSGFGMSGAAAIASAYAINKLLALKKDTLELAKIAHRAEVLHKTGLGDVGNQIFGGCCVKLHADPLFQMERFPFKVTPVYVRSWGKIPTPSILSNTSLLQAIDKAGEYTLHIIQKTMQNPSFSFSDLLDISCIFTEKSGLIAYASHAHKIITSIKQKGGHAAMIILGDAVVSDTPFEKSTQLFMQPIQASVLA